MSARTQGTIQRVRVAGVDGCRGGWLVVEVELCRGRFHRAAARFYRRIEEIVARRADLHVVALDMPIGLLDSVEPGGRLCDRLARRVLGWPRSSSVFTPPSRRQLRAARPGASRADLPRGLTLQAYRIAPKIEEVDRALCPRDQRRVVEAHPELALATLAGRSMRRNKKTKAGRRERLQALARLPMAWRRGLGSIMAASGRARPRRPFGSDDLLDAAVLVWTAWRIWQGRAVRLPADPPTDRRGLRMEIWY